MTEAGYEVVLLRHGETVGYDGDLGLTPLGERQARERGAALAKEIAPGTDVRMPHAQTARATATAEALRSALVDELGGEQVDGTTVGPLYVEPDLTNLRFDLHGDVVDTRSPSPPGCGCPTASCRTGPASSTASTATTATSRRRAARSSTGCATRRCSSSRRSSPRCGCGGRVAAFGALAGDRPLLVVATSHSGPMRAIVATAIGHDPGEPHNLEDVRVRCPPTARPPWPSATTSSPFAELPTMPPWFRDTA